jgi:hypothetical protein
MQEADAGRRIQLLRGLQVDKQLPADIGARDGSTAGRDRKRRKLAGEDDTQRDIRLAKQDTGAMVPAMARRSSDAPLAGKDGHINLFPQEPRFQVQKNPEAEAEAAKKKREYEDQYTMRFSNATGFKQGTRKPWYSSLQSEIEESAAGKDVWGNDDKGRKDRERKRMEDEDPLLAIRKGVSELKEVEGERRKWKEEREKEFRNMERDSGRRKKRNSYELEDFSLDHQTRGSLVDRRIAKTGSQRHNRSRSRSRSSERSHGHHSHGHKKTDHKPRHSEHNSRHKRRAPSSAKDDNMARLRQERDEREKKGRLKTAALLKAPEGDKPAWVKGPGRYSTQFADH